MQESLKLRKLALSKDQEAKVLSYASNANDDLLGLSRSEYDALVQEATIIIHVRSFPSLPYLSAFIDHVCRTRGQSTSTSLWAHTPHISRAPSTS